MTDIAWGPAGQAVFERTYSRPKPDGSKETWADTCRRVAFGNMALVHGPEEAWPIEALEEVAEVYEHMLEFKFLPAGRHLWATGVKGRQFLFNCHVSPWPERFAEHFEWVFLRLSEGGGVGTNFSHRFLEKYGVPRRSLNVHIVCDPSHPDYADMLEAGLLSTDYTSDWEGAFEVEDSREGWAGALGDLLDTYMTDDEVIHENRVYDVTNVRHRGARLKTFGGTASGPLPLARMLLDAGTTLNVCHYEDEFDGLDAMTLEHSIAEAVVAGGNRRSARMSVMEWTDRAIFDFIRCKSRGAGDHYTTNISVAVNDEFFRAINDKRHPRHDWASEVHSLVTQGMLLNGEPGYWNMGLSQHGELSEVICTNPCGEITLTEREPCVIGSVNLEAFVHVDEDGNPDVDYIGIHEAHRLLTRFLIRATFGDVTDPGQRGVLDRNRRIGVGHMGVAGHLALRGIRWSGAVNHPDFRFELRAMYETVREEADDYAFALRIPAPIKVTTVAPTGSIAKLPGVSEGIHPIYARYFLRRMRFSLADADQAAQVEEFRAQGFKVEQDIYDRSGNTVVVEFPTKESLVEKMQARGIAPEIAESADEIGLEDMLKFLRMYQGFYADNAVSFTANVPMGRYSQEAAEGLVMAYLEDVKGLTLMPDESRPQAPYERLTLDEFLLAGVTTIEDSTDEDCGSGACPIR